MFNNDQKEVFQRNLTKRKMEKAQFRILNGVLANINNPGGDIPYIPYIDYYDSNGLKSSVDFDDNSTGADDDVRSYFPTPSGDVRMLDGIYECSISGTEVEFKRIGD